MGKLKLLDKCSVLQCIRIKEKVKVLIRPGSNHSRSNRIMLKIKGKVKIRITPDHWINRIKVQLQDLRKYSANFHQI
jgi:hypothetical protein